MTMSPALRSHHLALIEVHHFFYGKEITAKLPLF